MILVVDHLCFALKLLLMFDSNTLEQTGKCLFYVFNSTAIFCSVPSSGLIQTKSDSSSASKEHPRTQQQRSASRMHLTLKRPFVPLCLTPAYRAKRSSAISVAKLLGRIVLFHSGLIVPALHSGALCDTCRTVQVNGRR